MNCQAHKKPILNRTKNMWLHTVVFTGKEKDEETGYGYFGARYMDHELMTMWLSVDPMADKYPQISPYNYCMWNPIKVIDPDGMDTLVFNKYGNYSHRIIAEGEHVGRYDQPSGSPYVFNFADPVNDPIAIERKEITRLQIVKEDDIRAMLSNAGVFDDENRENRVAYALANGHKELDFAMKPNRGLGFVYGKKTYKSIYLVDGVAHNPANFGNFLYGAACEALGFSLFITKLGAHYNSRFGDAEKNGYSHQWDSQDDQFSIKCGYRHAQGRGYHNINHKRTPVPCLP